MLEVHDLTADIGSQVELSAGQMIGGEFGATLRDLLDRRGILLFRNVHLGDQQLRLFARSIGRMREDVENGVLKVSFDETVSPLHFEYFAGTLFWHIDGTYEDMPPRASILTPTALSPTGGETEFANTYAAYDHLPTARKAQLDELMVVHSMEAAMSKAVANPSKERKEAWDTYPVRTHPLVWRHRNGRKSLILSSSCDHVVGMDRDESDELLEELLQWATQPRFIYQHRWQIGDVVIWDNTGTMHRVREYDPASGRRLHRVTLLGEEPFGQAA